MGETTPCMGEYDVMHGDACMCSLEAPLVDPLALCALMLQMAPEQCQHHPGCLTWLHSVIASECTAAAENADHVSNVQMSVANALQRHEYTPWNTRQLCRHQDWVGKSPV